MTTPRAPHGSACRLTVFVGDGDRHRHTPLYVEIVHRAHRAGLAGASVFHGIEGFGRSGRVHTSRLVSVGEDLPVCVVIVDTDERIRRFLPQLDGIITDGLVTVEPVEAHWYGPAGGTDHDR